EIRPTEEACVGCDPLTDKGVGEQAGGLAHERRIGRPGTAQRDIERGGDWHDRRGYLIGEEPQLRSAGRGTRHREHSADVSPNSLMYCKGPAPSGRSVSASSLTLMSSNSLAVSTRAFSSTSAYTTESPGRVVDVISETRMFWATRSSIFRVTSCSTRSALWPGHGVTTATWRTGMSGSFRFGIAAYAQTPHAMTPISST